VSNTPGRSAFLAARQGFAGKQLTGPRQFAYGRVMSHRSTALATILDSRYLPVSRFIAARQVAIIVVVLVLLITNGGAG